MAELDFSKIFGETATSKASFTDENYLNGWGYLGNTPPPYQLFDYLQSLNDKKSKYLYDNINENKNNLLAHNTATDSHQPILNAIKAISGMSAYDIAPSKTIAAMIPLLGYGGIIAQKLEENGYVKFANGLIIQWGYHTDVADGTYIPFPISFASACWGIAGNDMLSEAGGNMQVISFANVTTAGFNSYAVRISGAPENNFFRYIAIGK